VIFFPFRPVSEAPVARKTRTIFERYNIKDDADLADLARAGAPEGVVVVAELNAALGEGEMAIWKVKVQEMAKKAPLSSMMTATVMGAEGFTTATINSVEDDLEGRAIKHAADAFNWEAPFLYFALNRAKEKYGFDLEALVAHINGAPFFAPSREPLLREGLAAWMAEDAVKAIHVLVPQVEAACRDGRALSTTHGSPGITFDGRSRTEKRRRGDPDASAASAIREQC